MSSARSRRKREAMPGDGKNGKKKEVVKESKEKKPASHAETRADDQATGQQGLASIVAARASHSQSMVMRCRMKAKIQKEFKLWNQLKENTKTAQYNENCYQKYKHQNEEK